MALIIPPGYLQAVYVIRLAGDSEDMVVTCGHELDSASGANADDAANDLFIAFKNELIPAFFNAEYSLDNVTVYLGQDGPTLVNISDQPAEVGGGSFNVQPPNVAYLIRKRTDLGGRRGRGRFYMPCVSESTVDAVGNVSTTAQTNIQTALDDWMTALTDTIGSRLYPPVVLHRSEGIGTEPPPTPITRFTIDSKVATQRRRLRP